MHSFQFMIVFNTCGNVLFGFNALYCCDALLFVHVCCEEQVLPSLDFCLLFQQLIYLFVVFVFSFQFTCLREQRLKFEILRYWKF